MKDIEIIQYNDHYKQEVNEFIINIKLHEFDIENVTYDNQPDLKNITSTYLNTGGQFWLALYDGKVVGTIALQRLKDNNGALKRVYVDQNVRNMKIGKKLLLHVIEASKKDGIQAIYLGTIDKFEAAQHFYRKNGFHLILKEDLPQDFPLVPVDNIFYYKDI
ncbi:GNAT family N-acetyltransferase [Macrococcoides caseolyticum]|uniref:GNAT family N-acetyltransferase n=1 Tax=Macrococcoides caseolyticum TaxID=69966 RepID=UPI001F38296E|nr:GNAT family N-acetyltransferase [Macrococcus caseolyticus]MCE4956817.1 GNAT family N-acetyltransferase [Macrococcus caseolyticus]